MALRGASPIAVHGFAPERVARKGRGDVGHPSLPSPPMQALFLHEPAGSRPPPPSPREAPHPPPPAPRAECADTTHSANRRFRRPNRRSARTTSGTSSERIPAAEGATAVDPETPPSPRLHLHLRSPPQTQPSDRPERSGHQWRQGAAAEAATTSPPSPGSSWSSCRSCCSWPSCRSSRCPSVGGIFKGRAGECTGTATVRQSEKSQYRTCRTPAVSS